MINLLFKGISVILAIIFHETAHGYASYLLGDPTPKYNDRLSLNPLKHLDPIGALCLLIFGFGWAKPVEIDSRYYKNEKLGTCITALAGPGMNFILACISAFLSNFINIYIINEFLKIFIAINIGLCCFNLIPLPPLDGSKILATFLPYDLYYKFMSIERYSMIILIIILSTGMLNPILTLFYKIAFNIVSLFIF